MCGDERKSTHIHRGDRDRSIEKLEELDIKREMQRERERERVKQRLADHYRQTQPYTDKERQT